ncbi:MAG TPA: amidase family protein [Vicinamibacterales bacterium]|nr:amidase family protein [Vicinamibacterales bacterium]
MKMRQSRVRAAVSLAMLTAAVLAMPARTGSSSQADRQSGQWAGDRYDVIEKSIAELQDAMRSGAVTSRELSEIYLARIEAYDRGGPRLNAMIAINPGALDDAAALDAERAAGRTRGPLHGIPVVVKDNFDMAGLPTTGGSLALADLRPERDAFQVRKLREAGAVILGKTNLHELASGITTVSSLGGQTRNPYDPSRNPGGSSGGTGAAVAANLAAAGLGTDTCGSIRIPAAQNALVGLRPTVGLSSRTGVLPLSHSQDVAGPLARSVADLALMLDATVASDEADPVTMAADRRQPRSYRDALAPEAVKGARIGVLTALFGEAAEDREAAGVVRRALEGMKEAGAEIIEVTVPGLEQMLSGTSVIDHEFKGDLAGYLGGFSKAPVRTLDDILAGGLYHAVVEGSLRRRNRAAGPESEPYRRARIKRDLLKQAVLAAMEEHRLEALAYPTLRRQAALIGQPQAGSTCQLSAATGLPALSVPAGFTGDELPIGLELLGRAYDEARLLSLARGVEQKSRVRRPPFSAPALVGRGAPAPLVFATELRAGAPSKASLAARLTFDGTTGRLAYDARAMGVRAEDVLGAWIQREADDRVGAAVHQILARGEDRASGALVLPPVQQRQLREGRMHLGFYVRGGIAARHAIAIDIRREVP